MEVTLGTSNNRHSRVKVARVIAEQFVCNPLPYEYTEVNHKDFDRTNNKAENLEQCSHKNNVSYSALAGHYKCHNGENNGRAKLNQSIVDEIREAYCNGKTIAEISKLYDKPYSTIFNIVHNKTQIK